MAKKDRCTINQSIKQIIWPMAEGEPLVLHVERISQSVMDYAAFHGLKQKVTDAMALPAEKFGGRVPESAKRSAAEAVIAHLEKGLGFADGGWNLTRQPTGPRTDSRVGYLVRALMEVFGKKTEEQYREWLKDKSTAEQLSLSNNPKLKGVIDGYIAEATAHIDTDAMFDELEGLE